MVEPTVLVAGVAAAGAIGSAWYSSRAARAAARETASSNERIEQERLRREEVNQLRTSLEAIITRLTEEVRITRDEVHRVRDQLDREESVSDQLRGRVRELEEQVHKLNLTILDLQQRLAEGVHAFVESAQEEEDAA